MTLADALERFPPGQLIGIRLATGTDGNRWYWFWDSDDGECSLQEIYRHRRFGWCARVPPEYPDPEAVDWCEGHITPPPYWRGPRKPDGTVEKWWERWPPPPVRDHTKPPPGSERWTDKEWRRWRNSFR